MLGITAVEGFGDIVGLGLPGLEVLVVPCLGVRTALALESALVVIGGRGESGPIIRGHWLKICCLSNINLPLGCCCVRRRVLCRSAHVVHPLSSATEA